MYINIGKDLRHKLAEILNQVIGSPSVILDITFYLKDCRVIYRNNNERKTYKVTIPYLILTEDIDKIKENISIKRHFDRKYENLH